MYSVDTGCPSYRDGYCLWLSSECGRAEYATGPRCERDCKRDRPAGLALRVLPIEHNPEFIARTYSKSPDSVVVRVPPSWPVIERTLLFAGVLDSEHIQGVYMTGSSIRQGNDDPKDFDIAIVVYDLAAWLAEGSREKLPREVNGKRLDIWIHVDKLSPLHPMLDCTDRVLHLPMFGPDISYTGEGITVRPADYSAWTPEQRAVLHQRVREAEAMAVEQKPVVTATMATLIAPPAAPTSDCGCSRKARR